MLRMESTTILFFLAALPVILILMYIYNKDKTKETDPRLMSISQKVSEYNLNIFVVSNKY